MSASDVMSQVPPYNIFCYALADESSLFLGKPVHVYDDSFVKNYIWSLYRNDCTEEKAYEKGKYYISKIENPESLSYVMGLTCSYLEKWIEAYDFYKNCLSRNIDVQEEIDKIIDKISNYIYNNKKRSSNNSNNNNNNIKM